MPSRDNVFPRSIMVISHRRAALGAGRRQPAAACRQASPTPASTADIPVVGNAPPLNSEWPYVRIDDEWIRITRHRRATPLHVASAQACGAPCADQRHNAGARVLIGYTFSRIFSNPAARDYWGQ